MAKNEKIYVTNRPGIGGYKFLIADGTTIKDIYTCATAEGEVVTGIILINNSAGDKKVTLYVHNGTTAFKLGTIKVAANSGSDGTTAVVDGLSKTMWPGIVIDNAGNKRREMDSGWKIQGKLDAAVSADNDIEITVLTGKLTAEA